MKSKQLGEGGSSGKAACLARNFNTKNISLEMSPDEVVYEQSTSILTSEGLYSAMKVVSVTKDTEVTCKAHFKSSTITANATLPEKEAEEPVTRTSNRVCNSTDTSAQGTKVERVNMVSLTVLGLRVLLAKSIAFNTLMSMKMFLF
ncbi:TRDC protein, partial [Pitta sordida]|nr:TRDC protein [Pitta sordida]